MNQSDFQAIQNMLHRWDELSESINNIVGAQMLMRDRDYNVVEAKIDAMKTEKAKIVNTVKSYIAGHRTDFWK